MLKRELATKVSEQLGYLLKKDAEQAVEIILENISMAISEGRRVEIRGFGTFSTRERQPRTTVNPKTGKTMDIPARKTAHFTMSQSPLIIIPLFQQQVSTLILLHLMTEQFQLIQIHCPISLFCLQI